MDKYITLEWPYDRVVLQMQIPKPGRLTFQQWNALENAEAHLYRGEQGSHGWTDVMDRLNDGLPADMWAQAELAVEATTDFTSCMTEDTKQLYLLHQTARRVAQSLAVLSFGPEFLLK